MHVLDVDRVGRPDPILLEACKNARLLARVCELLEGHPPALEEHVVMHDQVLELQRDYDPDVDGWPWETDHL